MSAPDSSVHDAKSPGGFRPLLQSLRNPALVSAEDRRLMRGMSLLVLVILVVTAGFTRLQSLYGHKFFDSTGRAQWIWPQHRVSQGTPIAFFATRTFDLPPNRSFARIKILGDPQYTLWFNGQEIGGRRVGEEHALDVFDVSALARDRDNRLVVAVRSPNGVGGLITSVDVSPEFKNLVPTGSDWKILREWHPDLALRDPARASWSKPMLLGAPPARRWNYLGRQAGTPPTQFHQVLQPIQRWEFDTALPDIEVIGGVAVSASRAVHATVFDFGQVTGNVRLTLGKDSAAAHNVNVRFANSRADLQSIEGSVEPFVFAAREGSIIDPEKRDFRYVMVYGSEATVEVLR